MRHNQKRMNLSGSVAHNELLFRTFCIVLNLYEDLINQNDKCVGSNLKMVLACSLRYIMVVIK